MKSIPPLHLDPPLQLGSGEGSSPGLALVSRGIEVYSGALGRTGVAGKWGCFADKVTLLAGNQVEWELSEDGLVAVLPASRIVLVEDHRLGLGSPLHCTGRSGTLLRQSPDLRHAKINKTEGYCVGGVSPVSFETISVVRLVS